MKGIFSGLWIWVGVMIVSLGGAYWASLPQTNQGRKSPTQNVDPRSIGSVELSQNGSKTLAEREANNDGRWWISTNSSASSESVAPESPLPQSKFLASEKFISYLEVLGKLPAQRDLGVITDASLGDFGLLNPENWLRIKNAKGEVIADFTIGKQPYGARSFYVMRAADRKVFLIGSDIIEDLLKPEARFFERNISKMPMQNSMKARILMAGKVKSFVRIAQDDRGVSQWADEAAPGQVIPAVGAWLETFFEIRSAAYADDSLRAKLDGLSPTLEVALLDEKGRSEKIEVRSIALNGRTEFYVVSDFLAWPVKVATARVENLMRDLPPLLQN